jgi:hypothetical protein
MNPDPCSRRFDPGRRLPVLESDGAPLCEKPDTALPVEADESTVDPPETVVDEALEQIASEGCMVCPLCGAIVASDGAMLG